MKVIQTVAVISSCLLGTAAMAQDRIYDVDGFDEVVIADGVFAEIVVGPAFAVSAEALRGDIDRLDVAKQGGSLVISRNQAWGLFAQGRGDRFAVKIALPILSEIESRSGATAEVAGATAALTGIQVSSGADMTISEADLADVRVEVSSGSNLSMAGECDSIDARASSGSSLYAADLLCQTAELRGSSGASLDAHATETARARGSSGASIRLFGGAELVDQSTSSGSSIDIN